MSVNQHYRAAWVKTVFAQAVSLFHRERKFKKNANTPLADLARKCANTVFAEQSNTIVGDKELCAREFMKYCRDNFGSELVTAIQARTQQKMETAATQPQGVM